MLGNIGFVSGVDLILTRHPDPREIAAARFDHAGYLATTADGWYEIEGHDSGRKWCWAKTHSTLHVSAWHQRNADATRLTFTLRGFVPGNVTITSNDPPGKRWLNSSLEKFPLTAQI